MSKVLELTQLSKSFVQGDNKLVILEDANLTLQAGQTASLIGPSGAGKSTFLHIAGLLEQPDSGEIMIDGIAAHNASERQRTLLRRKHIGFVYQQHHLLPDFSALENVMLPLRIANMSRNEATTCATELLEQMGLQDRVQHRPAALSGGEQQRVAIARALVHKPALLLADEPTGNLDPETAADVFSVLTNTVKESNTALLLVTHDHDLAAQTNMQYALEQHKVVKID